VQPVASCYDPLAGPRPRVYASIAQPIAPEPGRLIGDVTGALRHATPLTAGQIVAWKLSRGATSPRELDAVASDWIDRARADERPIEPALEGPERRAFLHGAHRRALRGSAADPVIRRLAVELDDAHSQ
jgi:hypothetical protein